jgi:hypothetical protein
MSFVGNLPTTENAELRLHAHVVIGKSDGGRAWRTLFSGPRLAHAGDDFDYNLRKIDQKVR